MNIASLTNERLADELGTPEQLEKYLGTLGNAVGENRPRRLRPFSKLFDGVVHWLFVDLETEMEMRRIAAIGSRASSLVKGCQQIQIPEIPGNRPAFYDQDASEGSENHIPPYNNDASEPISDLLEDGTQEVQVVRH